MKAEHNGQLEYYKIDVSTKILNELKALKQVALNKGKEWEFSESFRRIVWRLRTNPSGFGEIVKHHPTLQLRVHVGSEFPLTVRFAFDETKLLVYIMAMFLASILDQP